MSIMNSLGVMIFSVLERISPFLSAKDATTLTGSVSRGVKANSRPPALREIRAGFCPVVGVTDHSTEPFVGICEASTESTACSPTWASPFIMIDGEAASEVPAKDSAERIVIAYKNLKRMKVYSSLRENSL